MHDFVMTLPPLYVMHDFVMTRSMAPPLYPQHVFDMTRSMTLSWRENVSDAPGRDAIWGMAADKPVLHKARRAPTNW